MNMDNSYLIVFTYGGDKIILTTKDYESAASLADQLYKNGYQVVGVIQSYYYDFLQKK